MQRLTESETSNFAEVNKALNNIIENQNALEVIVLALDKKKTKKKTKKKGDK